MDSLETMKKEALKKADDVFFNELCDELKKHNVVAIKIKNCFMFRKKSTSDIL